MKTVVILIIGLALTACSTQLPPKRAVAQIAPTDIGGEVGNMKKGKCKIVARSLTGNGSSHSGDEELTHLSLEKCLAQTEMIKDGWKNLMVKFTAEEKELILKIEREIPEGILANAPVSFKKGHCKVVARNDHTSSHSGDDEMTNIKLSKCLEQAEIMKDGWEVMTLKFSSGEKEIILKIERVTSEDFFKYSK